jgi:hypothetical protein
MRWPDRGERDGRDMWVASGEEKYPQKLNQKYLKSTARFEDVDMAEGLNIFIAMKYRNKTKN